MKYLLVFILIFLIWSVVLPVQAAGLVPCGGEYELECNFCFLLEMVKNIIDRLVILAAPIAVVFIVWGGYNLLLSGGSEERITQGKKILSSAVIGLLLVIISWIFVASIIGWLGRDSINFSLSEGGFSFDCGGEDDDDDEEE